MNQPIPLELREIELGRIGKERGFWFLQHIGQRQYSLTKHGETVFGPVRDLDKIDSYLDVNTKRPGT